LTNHLCITTPASYRHFDENIFPLPYTCFLIVFVYKIRHSMRNKAHITTFFCLFYLSLAAQNLSLDTLNQLIARSKMDTNRINFLLLKVRDHVPVSQPDTIFKICAEAYDLSQQLNFPRGQVNALLIRSRPNIIKGKFAEAEKDLSEAADIAQKQGLHLALGSIWNNLGIIRQNTGRRAEATDAMIQAAEAFEKADNLPMRVAVLGNLGSLFLSQNQLEKARFYTQKAYEVHSQLKDTAKAGYFLLNGAVIEKRLGDTLKAVQTFEKVLKIAENNPRDRELLYGALSNLGEIYTQTNRPERGLQLHQRALSLAQTIGSLDKIAFQYKHIANAYLQLGNATEAERFVDLALPLSKKTNELNRLNDLYDVAARVKSAIGKKDEALNLLRQYQERTDSTTNADVQKYLNELETRYQSALKDRDIAEKTAALERRKTLIISLLSLLFLSGMGFLFYRKQQRQRILDLEKEKDQAAQTALQKGTETERQRLARELHDGLGSLLSAAKMQFSAAQNQPSDGAQWQKAYQTLDAAHRDMRQLSHSLLPKTLEAAGLVTALAQFCEQVTATGQTEVIFENYGVEAANFSSEKALHLYRLTQELVNNALKHAAATQILVQLNHYEGQLNLTVEDNGKGFSPKKAHNTEGVGWANIERRVRELNGDLDIDTRVGVGTTITISM
jgi:two-component system, NarL family, sensor kinase